VFALDQGNFVANQIYSYRIDAAGTLTPLPGFPVAGSGETHQAFQKPSRISTAVSVINTASLTLSAFTVNPSSGALTPMPFDRFRSASRAHRA
jgi:hypothetical protein